MKQHFFPTAFLIGTVFLAIVASTLAEEEGFPGVQKAMSPEAFNRAGLNKLSPEERAQLDEFIRGFVNSSNEKAATAAVDTAVKTRKVTEPEVIQTRIVGPYKGYNGRSRFSLENGQVWAQAQQESRAYPPTDSPPVLIVKGGWGHRMYVLGGGNFRVTKIR